jgi:DMSO/TMAO reductase YedYZ molybdopterin-dependent catalytic subunit
MITHTKVTSRDTGFGLKLNQVVEVRQMVKIKKIFTGCGLGAVAGVMWLVSACTQSGVNSVPGQPIKTVSTGTTNSTTTSEPMTLSNAATILPSTTTTQPAENSAATNAPPATSVPALEGRTTPVDIDSYVLNVTGLVNNPSALSYAQILTLPSITKKVGIYCPSVTRAADEWTGVPLSTILNVAGLTPDATEIYLIGADGYYTVLTLQTALAVNVFLAYRTNGQELSEERGYPLRLIDGGSDGQDWVRWVTNIEVKSSLASISNPSDSIQNARSNVPTSGNKLCACFIPAVAANYRITQKTESKIEQSDSL